MLHIDTRRKQDVDNVFFHRTDKDDVNVVERERKDQKIRREDTRGGTWRMDKIEHGLEVTLEKQLKNFQLDMNFTMKEGCLGILGASGCGKSMTLKAIAGIVAPDAGRIVANGRVLYDSKQKVSIAPQKRKVGYLFQNYALFPNLTVWQNIAEGVRGGYGRRVPKEQMSEEIQELLERFHLEELATQYPTRLSGGQQQRVALARILASKPEVLLLDEPFSALDSYLKEALQLELKHCLQSFGGCSIIVSHDRDEVYKLCSHTMVMGEGKNLRLDETAALFADPKHPEAARLTGCKNISKAKKIASNRVRALDWGFDFMIDRKISDTVSYIGIRAHDFLPVAESRSMEKNVMKIRAVDTTKSPFEWTMLFRNEQAMSADLWMKSEHAYDPLPEYVWVDEKKILLLEE
jgi:molybdate transport system ATP-binding protein